MKEGIQNLQNSLGEKDKLILCAFGEEVTLAADGNQTPESMAGILAGLDNNDQKTLLFEGIDRAAALASGAEGEECRRKVLAVISDGEDIAVGKKMAAEAQETLKETGLPAYAFCIRDTATVNINSFGEFARTSGGDMITFQPDEGAQILTDLAARLHQDVYAEYKADTNIVTNQEETFSLRLADGRVLTRDVMNVYWIPDEEAPYLLSGTMAGDRQIKLTFSEAVTGLEAAANYQVSFGGEPVGVTGVAYDKEDELIMIWKTGNGILRLGIGILLFYVLLTPIPYPYPDTLVVTDASVSDEDIVRRIMEQQLTYYTRMGLLYPDRIFAYEIVRIIPTTDATKPKEPLYSVVYSVKNYWQSPAWTAGNGRIGEDLWIRNKSMIYRLVKDGSTYRLAAVGTGL